MPARCRASSASPSTTWSPCRCSRSTSATTSGSEVERVAVAPDTGRAKLAGKFAEMIGGGLVVLNKERPGHNQAKVTGVIGDVAGKVAVMTDDIIDTAGRSVPAPRRCARRARREVIACATHALFNDPRSSESRRARSSA